MCSVGSLLFYFLGRTFILSSSDNDYRINCCGYVSSWEFYVGDSTGTLFAQVWRPSGTDWQLVNQTAIKVTRMLSLVTQWNTIFMY